MGFPEFVSTGHGDCDCKSNFDHHYEINVPLREITKEELDALDKNDNNNGFYNLHKNKTWYRNNKGCKLWINATATTIQDSDILLYSDKFNKEYDFVHKIPAKYIKEVNVPVSQAAN